MFIGHIATGFAFKRIAPSTSLGLLIAAPLTLDLLWPFFLMAGAEKVEIDPGNTAFTPLDFVSYPYTHSLVMSLVWSLLFGALYFAATRYARGALVLGAGVFSHWVLDFVSHRPDLPLYPGGTLKLGLGLWNSVPATIVVEGALFLAGVWLYASFTRARDGAGVYGFWSFVGVAVFSYVSNILGPPPPSPEFLAQFALLVWLFPPWAWWFDRRRAVTFVVTS